MSDLISKAAVLSLPRAYAKNARGKIFKEFINVKDVEALPSAQPERQVELDGTESNIEILSELRAQFNCFDEAEEPVYRALSDAICVLSSQPEQNNLMADAHKRLMDETGGKAVCKNEHWGRGDNNG